MLNQHGYGRHHAETFMALWHVVIRFTEERRDPAVRCIQELAEAFGELLRGLTFNQG